MKNDTKKKGTNHRNGDASPSVVHLEFAHPTAATVFVAASFNGWRPETTPMISFEGGRWIKELALPPGTYEYCVVVDGEWMQEPLTTESISNPSGGQNYVLKV